MPDSDADARWLYRIGGVSALAIAVGYVAIIGLYVPMGAPPSGAEARLAYISPRISSWWAILGLSVLTDVLFLPVFLSLYDALKGIQRSALVLACFCVCLFVFLDLALTWTNFAALITLSRQYVSAAGEAQRAVVTAATYPTAVLESSLLFVYNSLTLAIGMLIGGGVMRKSNFGRATAYLGIVTGASGIVAVVGSFVLKALGATIILTSILTTVWMGFVGIDLLRISRR